MTKLLELRDLSIKIMGKPVVNNVSFDVEAGEVFGLVGESGAGKSLTGKAIIRLLPPGAEASGKIFFKGIDLLSLDEKAMRKIRGKEITLIQQDPVTSLNPSFKIKDQITDIIGLHLRVTSKDAEKRAVELLKKVGITSPEKVLHKYPHQISGGMCQRVMIAIAFACEPSLVIADEPTTALDVITQALVIDLMKHIQQQHNTAIIFVTHNLALALNICDRIAVMNKGSIVEVLDADRVFEDARHEYTLSLLSAIPTIEKPFTR